VGNGRYYLLILLLVPILISVSVNDVFAQETHIVTIPLGSSDSDSGLSFIPKEIVIKVGDIVEWQNFDTAHMGLISGFPENGTDGKFQTRLFGPEKIFGLVFNEPGIYPYYNYPWLTGTIIVEEGTQSLPITFGNTLLEVVGKSGSLESKFYNYRVSDPDGLQGIIFDDDPRGLSCRTEHDFQNAEESSAFVIISDCSSSRETSFWSINGFEVLSIEGLAEHVDLSVKVSGERFVAGETIAISIVAGTPTATVSISVNGETHTQFEFAPRLDLGGAYTTALGSDNLEPGLHTFVVTDANGNSASTTATLLKPEPEPEPIPLEGLEKFVCEWDAKQTSDLEFLQNIQVLLNQKELILPPLSEDAEIEDYDINRSIPDWVRNNANWWCDNMISDKDLENALSFLVRNGNLSLEPISVETQEAKVQEPVAEPEPPNNDTIPPELLMPADMILTGNDPDGTVATYSVKAIDNFDQILNPDCDPPSGSVFPLKVTIVRCTVTDSSGNIDTDSFKVLVKFSEFVVPEWVKDVAGFWCGDEIDDASFVQAIQYLITSEVLIVPPTESGGDTEESNEIPAWIKNNACWWSQGVITDGDFVNGIQYLIGQGIFQCG